MFSVLFGAVMVLHMQANHAIHENVLRQELAVNGMYSEDAANSIWYLQRHSFAAKPVATQWTYYDPETNTFRMV